MKCEEEYIKEIKCSISGKIRGSQVDGVKRCAKHYRLKFYGYCIENHLDQVLATGHDHLCNKCRYGKESKSTTRSKNLIGKINSHGVRIVDGPYKQYGKNKNATAWEMICPECNKSFVSISSRFNNLKSCYECRGNFKRVTSEFSTFKHLYAGVKGRKNAKLRGFDLSLEDFIELSQKNCYYCGASPAISKGHREWSAYVKMNGLDRINNSKGYTLNNVCACCRICNTAKGTMSREEFLAWAFRLVQHQQNK